MSDGPGLLLPLAGAAAGALSAVAGREAVLASPALARWLRGHVSTGCITPKPHTQQPARNGLGPAAAGAPLPPEGG